MNFIKKWYAHSLKIAFIGKGVIRQKLFLKKEINPIIKPFFTRSDASLTEKDYNKIFQYYGLIVPSILGEFLCFYRGEKMSKKERKYTTLQVCLTGVVDDFFDEYNTPLQRVVDLLDNKIAGKTSAERFCQLIYQDSIHFFEQKNDLRKSLIKVLNVQEESLKQKEHRVFTKQELLDLTIKKGGESFHYYCLLYLMNLSKEEKDFFYLLGGITQFGNDIFDLYKDREERTETLLTITDDINEVKELFLNLIKQLYIKARNLSNPKVFLFLDYYAIGVFNRCIICLDQYLNLQKASNFQVFTLKKYARHELICDMEKPKNIILSFTMDIKKEINF